MIPPPTKYTHQVLVCHFPDDIFSFSSCWNTLLTYFKSMYANNLISNILMIAHRSATYYFLLNSYIVPMKRLIDLSRIHIDGTGLPPFISLQIVSLSDEMSCFLFYF